MSLKDSLNSARTRAGGAARETEKITARSQQNALETRIDRALREAAVSTYQSICDRIADEICRGKGDPRPRIDGYIELPDRLRVPVAGLQDTCAVLFDSSNSDITPETDGAACSVRLTRIRREELFWGYRMHLELTQYGATLVDAVRRRAANEGISIRTYVIEEALGSERRYVEMSQFKGTARCTGSDGIACRLALRYRFNGSREEVAP